MLIVRFVIGVDVGWLVKELVGVDRMVSGLVSMLFSGFCWLSFGAICVTTNNQPILLVGVDYFWLM